MKLIFKASSSLVVFQGIAFMESLVAPFASWNATGGGAEFQSGFQALRTEKGDHMILKNNFFVGALRWSKLDFH